MKTYDVLVVGGGLAGLTSAAALSAAGKSVVVLEQYSVVGGSTHVFRRKGKWEWQVGVHHMADCGPNGDMPTIFRGLGLGEHITYEQMDTEGYERYAFPDLEFDAPNDWDEYRTRLTDLFPAERRKIEKFLVAVRKIGNSVDRGPSLESAAGLAKTAFKIGRYAPLAAMSATGAMNVFGRSIRLQVLLSASPCGSLNCPPDRLPFAAFATFLHRFVQGGAWFPHGGGQVFASNLVRVIEQFGGQIVTGAYADEILVENGRASGVRLTGGATYRADAVICTADIKKTYNNLIPSEAMKASDLKRVNGYRMSTPFFNAFLGVDVDLRKTQPNRDQFAMPSWMPMGELEKQMRFAPDDTAEKWVDRMRPILPAYVHCSDLKDPTTTRYSPDGCSSLEVMFPIRMNHRMWEAAAVDHRDHDYSRSEKYRELKESIIDVLIDRTIDVLPEVAGHVVHREAATPLTQERFTQSTEGACYGIEWNMRQNGIFRPGARTHIPDLYLAGASCRSGPATEGVLLSGIIAAGAILDRNLLAEFRAGNPLIPAGSVPPVPTGWDPLSAAKPRGIRNTVVANEPVQS